MTGEVVFLSYLGRGEIKVAGLEGRVRFDRGDVRCVPFVDLLGVAVEFDATANDRGNLHAESIRPI